MLPRALPVVACLLVALAAPGVEAARRPTHLAVPTVATPGLELADGRIASDTRELQWRAQPAATSASGAVARLRRELGAAWIAWDDATGVPRRIALAGLDAPGVIASADRAAEVARAVLDRHLALLAPGSVPADFVLVGNHVGDGLRSVGFVQTSDGRPVLGGAISFRFKADRLVGIASDAWPYVPAAAPGGRIVEIDARTRAHDWVGDDVLPARIDDLGGTETIVVPLLVDGGVDYREAVRVRVDTHAPRSRWSVYVDAATGAPIARRQELSFASGGVAYNAPIRGPNGTRLDYGAPFVDVVVDGAPISTDALGVFPFAAGAATATNSPVGPFVQLFDTAGPVGVSQFTPQDGSAFVWNAQNDEFLDAQLTAYVHTSRVKQYVRPIATDLAWLDGQIAVNVNIEDICNAFSDGDSINFFRSSESCENTGRIADVVYHEFGHSVHTQSVIPGVGVFNTSLSEGTSDYLAATIVNDSGVGRGFFYDDSPLREINPSDKEFRWPDDRGEVHDEGRIIAGALWDLRELLIDKYGAAIGVQITDRIWYESTRRAVDIPSMYFEALVVDDDDGNLANGTPNGCEINAAYGPHGLYSPGEGGAIVTATGSGDSVAITLQLALPSFPNCPIDASPSLSYQFRDQPELGGGEAPMVEQNGAWVLEIGGLAEGSVLQYQVHANYSNGALGSLPDNFVDPWYELYIGEVVPIYCTGFEDLAAGWSLTGDFGAGVPGGGSPDPGSGVTTPEVLANALAGTYSPFTAAFAKSPPVATAGFQGVRLQYRRWLTVEDGFFDQAAITVDDSPVWNNFTSQDMDYATMHHIDREWRFHDVDITAQALDGQITLGFSLTSDGGLELGGWTIDDLCIVGVQSTAGPLCGNGLLDPGEGCDDGNLAAGDGCDAACLVEGGSGSGDSGSDDGGSDSSGGDDPGQDEGGLVGRGCACTSDANERSWSGLLLAIAGILARRRRR
ncbi:MAG TPA: hypothetical protein VFG69_14520 [Nannocystaceae bacterium]|nr:hypothetical protein [Nannocystaceae bacterium]